MNLNELLTYIRHGKDILECHIGEKEEYCSVDIHHPVLCELLTEKYYSNDQRHHLRIANQN